MGGCVGMKSGLWVGSDGWDTFVGECAGVVNRLMVGFLYVDRCRVYVAVVVA